jgi:hypothetical protein
LFREDSFAVKAINRLLFSDEGRKFLMILLKPVVMSILAVPNLIDVRTT